MSENGSLSMKPVVRLCHIIKWEDYDGYGFNLHAEKSKPGQFIGKVDEGSPAQAAGLKEGDRIIEVNGDNVTEADHKQVVNKIKQVENETKLLVVDKESYEYFLNNGVTITSTLPEVVSLKTPPRQERTNGNGTSSPDSDKRSLSSAGSEKAEKNEGLKDAEGNKLMLNMTVDEYRMRLAQRKKFDPKKESMDVKRKHEIIDKM